MKTTKQLAWKIIGSVAVLSATFALGYGVGSKSDKPSLEPINTLSSTDMEHAFGSVKPADHPATIADHAAPGQEPTAMNLSGLVAGLEKKVAANPENIDQQLLLAQTYSELDNRDKSLKLLRVLNKQAAKNAQVKITFATILMKGEDKQELKEASQLFDEVIKLKPDAASMARMYQGEIRAKLGNVSK
jgi:cytochrome c-type biogenesis protein CcmH/NrfG